MRLPDVNVLVTAFRQDAPQHQTVRRWLDELIDSPASFGLSDLVLSGFLRIVTHPRVFQPPTPIDKALEFAIALRSQPNCVPVSPGERHWQIFTHLCQQAQAKGNLIPDAFFAALAIESGSEWITSDRDFSRFDGLSWRSPTL